MVDFRGFEDRDYGPLGDIIDNEWDFHLYDDDWEPLTKAYLYGMMSRSDFVKVAVSDGKTVGIVCASSTLPSTMETEPETNAPQYERERVMFDRIDFGLREGYVHERMGELTLIIVSSDCKKSGIGSSMLELAREHLMQSGCVGMYISTDTDCDYGFYDHIGCELLGSRECVSLGETIVRSLYRMMF